MTLIDFLKKYKIIIIFAFFLIAFGAVSLVFTKGLNLSLEFQGGAEAQILLDRPMNIAEIKTALDQKEMKVVPLGLQEFMIRIPAQAIRPGTDLKEYLLSCFHKINVESSVIALSYIGGEFSQETTMQSFIGMSVVLIALLCYISLRFQWRLACGAILALLFDPLIILGTFSFFQWTFDLATLAGLLSVMGYSINDTIVVFDRFKENLEMHMKQTQSISSESIFYASLSQIFYRTIMTSVLTSFVIISLLIFDIEVLRGFSLSFGLGIIIGTVSSIVIAGPCALFLGIHPSQFLNEDDPTLFDPRHDLQFKKHNQDFE